MKLRVGRHAPRNLWLQRGAEPSDADQDVGRVDSPELAALLVVAFNRTFGPLLTRRPDWPDGAAVLDAVNDYLNQPSATDGGPKQGES